MMRPQHARLVWRDEFGEGALDQHQWSFETSHNKHGWFNGERQYYSANRPVNLRLSRGRLIIEARAEQLDPLSFPDWGGQTYTSARIISDQAWRFGFFEVRAKLPCARGMWPAIWMLPKNMQHWPDDGEIDIMEQVGAEPNLIYATCTAAVTITRSELSAAPSAPFRRAAAPSTVISWTGGRIQSRSASTTRPSCV